MPLPLRTDDKQNAPRLKDEARFFKSWIEKPLVTGAVSPSGRALARMMARYVDAREPGPVIELGPGTGPVTEALIARGISPKRLVLIEFNPDFLGMLAERFPGVTVLHGNAFAVRRLVEQRLDAPAIAVVSSLPLLTKPPEQRGQLVNDCFDLCRPNAPFIQFTYAMNPPVPVEAIGQGVRIQSSPRVWWNLPPAQVWVYRRPAPPV